MMTMPLSRRQACYLTIAGSDSSCGAGAERDAAVIRKLGGWCVTAHTGRTLQGPNGVVSVTPAEPETLYDEIIHALGNFRLSGIKTGALFSAAQIEAVSEALKGPEAAGIPVVSDPVFGPSRGNPFLDEKGKRAYVEKIFPAASIITPNYPEAVEIFRLLCLPDTGQKIPNSSVSSGPVSKQDILSCLSYLALAAESRGTAIVVTGGHDTEGGKKPILREYVLSGGTVRCLKKYRRRFKNTHGTGCAFSSALLVEYCRTEGNIIKSRERASRRIDLLFGSR